MRLKAFGLLAALWIAPALHAQTLGAPTLNPTPGPFSSTGITLYGTMGAIGAGTYSGAGGSLSGGFAYRAPGTVVSIDTPSDPEAPLVTRLDGNYPNPFNPHTVIRYQLSVFGTTRLAVYDILGREVAVLVDGPMPAGIHTVTFNASGFASGVYVYRLEAGSQTFTRRMTLLK
jgi:hypothetical protein